MEISNINDSSLQKNGLLFSNLNGILKEKNIIINNDGQVFKPLSPDSSYGFIDTSNNHDSDSENGENTKNNFSFINDNINTFFIGSITVVGLFVLFRLLQKTK